MLPTGTITFLFTDIQGSTPLWERAPEKMAVALQVHNAALRRAIESNGGVVFKVVGDAFNAAFPTAPQALKAAIDGQRALGSAPWNELGPLKVRMGLHTGEAELDPGGDEYAVSHTKNRVSRVMSAGQGGQILLSEETADLVKRKLPDGVTLKDLGEHRLKGMEWPEHLYQVCVPGLSQDFPPLASGISHPNNLPRQMTSFVGREKEIDAVAALLAKHRLVTLTGSGGTGKTRLSLQAASKILENFPNGVWLVELALLADPDLIPKTVSSALNLPEISGKPVLELLVDFLRTKRLLLILDNCEHLLEACARLADKLLHACPELTILASSREFLGVTGEAPYRVPPMTLPDLRHLPSLEALSEFDAVHLFVERARVVSSDFAITENNANEVAQVVNRLDGIPLAIELAASRLRLLGIEQIAQRLNDTFRLLTGGSRTALPRHQTLRASIDWSYNLLSEPERILLRRLSVFAGGWRLQAAEHICAEQICSDGSDRSIHPEDILDLLSELVDKSLVNAVPESEGRMRYRMLETIRQYAHEKLVDEKEAEAVRTHHLDFYVKFAEELEPKLLSHAQIETLNHLEIELDNLRLAMEWARQTDAAALLRIASALKSFWIIRSRLFEGISWLEQGLDAEAKFHPETREEYHPTVIRARALYVLGKLRGELSGQNIEFSKQAMNALTESLSIYRSIHSEQGRQTQPEIQAGMRSAMLGLSYSDDPSQTLASVQEAMRFFRAAGDSHGLAESLALMSFIETDPELRKKIYIEILAIYETNGDVNGIAWALHWSGTVDVCNGYYEEAYAAVETSLTHYQRVNNPIQIADSWVLLGIIASFTGNLPLTRQCLDQSLGLFTDLGTFNLNYFAYFWKSMLAMAEGQFEEAGKLNDDTYRIAQKMGSQRDLVHILYCRARLARLQGDPVFARKNLEEAQNYAIDLLGYLPMLINLELGYLALESGDLKQAGSLWREGIQILLRVTDLSFMCFILDPIAVLAAEAGQIERAARLFGSRWCRGYSHLLSPRERDQRKTYLASIRAALGGERFDQLYEQGRTLSLHQVVEVALEENDE